MSIVQKDLERAYLTLQITFQQLPDTRGWESVEILQGVGSVVQSPAPPTDQIQHDAQILRIVKRIKQTSDAHYHLDDEEDELFEDDNEVMDRDSDDAHHLLVIYDIVHSPTYQVPVLYVTFMLCTSSARSFSSQINLDKVYELLAPGLLRPQMQSIGVMGALSMTDHPATGAAAYFVHPCRTVEAMDAVTGHEHVSPQKYLLMWIGLVGQSVGLEVPMKLAEAMMEAV